MAQSGQMINGECCLTMKSKYIYKQPNIVRVIKSFRIRWLGHVFRCDSTNPVKKVTFANMEGTRKRERHHTGWLDCVEADLK